MVSREICVQRLVVLNGVFLQEVIGEHRKLLAALPQGRKLNGDDVESKEQILAKFAARDRALEIAVGGGDDAHVHMDIVFAAESREFAVLEDLQQLGLQRRAHFADLVEEHRAVVRELELAGLVLNRAGEGAALEPEQLRFEQLGWQGGTIDLDERLVASKRDAQRACARPAPCPCRSLPE